MLRSWAQWPTGSAEASDVVVRVGTVSGAIAINLRSRGAGHGRAACGRGRHVCGKEWRMEESVSSAIANSARIQ